MKNGIIPKTFNEWTICASALAIIFLTIRFAGTVIDSHFGTNDGRKPVVGKCYSYKYEDHFKKPKGYVCKIIAADAERVEYTYCNNIDGRCLGENMYQEDSIEFFNTLYKIGPSSCPTKSGE